MKVGSTMHALTFVQAVRTRGGLVVWGSSSHSGHASRVPLGGEKMGCEDNIRKE